MIARDEAVKRYLIVGMSHTNSIARALEGRPGLRNVARVHLAMKAGPEEQVDWPFEPDFVALSIGGNQHNVMTLFEQRRPFTVAGLKFDKRNRVSIPLQVMKDTINQKNSVVRDKILAVHHRFPDAKFIYICAPPPIADTQNIRRMPELFERLSKNGFAPDGLRLAIYNLQSEWYRQVAENNGALFLQPPPESLDEKGMLAKEYCGGDPTHGNVKYGELVLEQILAVQE